MENPQQYDWRSAKAIRSRGPLYNSGICDHFSGSETLKADERTCAVLHVPGRSAAFVVHGDLDFEFYEFVLHDPGLFQGDLPEHCNFDGAFRCVFVGAEAVDLFAVSMCLGKRGDHGIGDSILWYCSERTVSDYLSGDLRRSRRLRKKSGDS